MNNEHEEIGAAISMISRNLPPFYSIVIKVEPHQDSVGLFYDDEPLNFLYDSDFANMLMNAYRAAKLHEAKMIRMQAAKSSAIKEAKEKKTNVIELMRWRK